MQFGKIVAAPSLSCKGFCHVVTVANRLPPHEMNETSGQIEMRRGSRECVPLS
jgi:hypothetical protein